MTGRDIQIPFGPDKTGGLNPELRASDTEEKESPAQSSAEVMVLGTSAEVSHVDSPKTQSQTMAPLATSEATEEQRNASVQDALSNTATNSFRETSGSNETDYQSGGLTDEEAEEYGVDKFQLSVLALKDSIGQSRELKEREKDREELADALKKDHRELSDREGILLNYQSVVAEQDTIIEKNVQLCETRQAEADQIAVEIEQTHAELIRKRNDYAEQMQPLDTELGRARAAADQAKNDERSRKSELSAAEAELRRAGETDEATIAIARHEQAQVSYKEARARSEQAKEQLAYVEEINREALERIKQDLEPLEHTLEDLSRREESVKQDIDQLNHEISQARKRRQYCDVVYQHPEETAKMRAEIEEAEMLARRMDDENKALRQRLIESNRKARSAKIAIGVVIAIIIVFIVCLVILSGR